MTQWQRVLELFQRQKTWTNYALHDIKPSIYQVPKKIWELKQKGYNIVTEHDIVDRRKFYYTLVSSLVFLLVCAPAFAEHEIGGINWDDYETIGPSTAMTFGLGGSEYGKIHWEKGYMEFEGNAAESAKVFFNEVLKPVVDRYIEERCKCNAPEGGLI